MHDGSKTASLKRNEVKMLLLSTSRPHVTLDGPSKRVVFQRQSITKCVREREREAKGEIESNEHHDNGVKA